MDDISDSKLEFTVENIHAATIENVPYKWHVHLVMTEISLCSYANWSVSFPKE